MKSFINYKLQNTGLDDTPPLTNWINHLNSIYYRGQEGDLSDVEKDILIDANISIPLNALVNIRGGKKKKRKTKRRKTKRRKTKSPKSEKAKSCFKKEKDKIFKISLLKINSKIAPNKVMVDLIPVVKE